MKTTNYRNLALAGITAAVLTACSSGGKCATCNNNNGGNSNTGDLSKLTFTAPNIVPSLPTLVGQGYIVATNNGDQVLNNLVYSVTEPVGGGDKITVDQASAANCQIIPAHGDCIFKVNVPAGTIAGSFVINGNQDSSLLTRLINKVLDVSVTPSTVIGVEQVPYTTTTGADGITLYYYSVVIAGTSYVVVSGAVASSNAGSFNNVVLVDGNNNVLPNQQSISGNLGAGLTNLSQGSTFALLVPVPSGTSASQVIKIQTQEVSASGKVSNIQTGTRQTPLSTTSGVGIVNLFPEAVYLTKDNPEQIITFYNNGDAQAQLEKLLATNSNVEVEFTPSAIGSNGKSTATLRLKNTSVSATNGNIALTYNNGKSGTTTVGKVDENVYPAPTPSPTPTPTPTPSPGPAPAPTPTAGLTVTVTPNNFNVSTAALNASRVLTLKNTGNTPEAGFTFSLTPGTFSLYSAGPAPTCSVSGNTVTTPLTANQECNLTIEYTSTNTTAGNYTTTMAIAYTYNGGTTATPLSTMYNSNVSQSSANLSSAASSVTDFGNVLNNNTATSSLYFKLTNTGEAQATNLVFSNSLNTLFSTIVSGAPSPACDISGSGTLTAGADCYYGIQFGPIPLSTAAGVQNNVTTVNYAWSSGGATGTPSTTQSTTGAVVTATSAAIALSGPTASGFAGGSGTSVSPYQIQENSTGTLTYTYTNTGTQAASNFYVFSPALPSGWTRSNSSTCPDSSGAAITLPNTGNNSCTAIFNINKNSTGTSDFHQDNMTYYWTDQAHPTGTSQQAPATLNYVNVYATPAVAAVMSSSSTGTPTITNPTESTDFYVVYTLTGGYSGQSFTYGVTLGGTPGSPGMSVYSPTTCTITSPATSCSIKIASGGAATNQSITYAPQGGAVTPTPVSSGNFDVVAAVPTWKVVGNADFSAGSATLVTLALTANSIPYVAYADGANGSKVTVMKLDGSIWKYIGESGFSDGQAIGSNISLGVDSLGTPYVAYVDASFNSGYGGVAVKKFNGTTWVNVGQNNMVSAGIAAYPSLAISSSDVPYLAYKNDQMGQIYAKAVKFNNNSESWDDIGTDGKVTAANAEWISLALNSSNQPFIACLDGSNQAGVLVRTYDGNGWQDVGNKITSSNDSYINIALNSSGNPRVGYLNNTNAYPTAAYNDNSGPGSQWSFYGLSSGFDNNTATNYISLALDTSGNPYMAFQDDPSGSLGRRKTASVITWSNSTWSYVGESQITSGEAKYTSLKLNSSNVPYLAFSDEAHGGKVMVMFYK